MAEVTKIEWCDSTFNGWWGCTKIAPACDNCYAAALDKRTGGDHWGNVDRRRTSEHNWNEPRRWQRKAADFFATHGRRRRVFCGSMMDWADNQVPPEWRTDLWALIRDCPDLDWLLLTKRPQNIVKMVKAIGFMPPNIAFGTTIEDRPHALQNLPHLMVAAGLRPMYLFASCEPLLGDLGDLSPWLRGDQHPQHLAEGERYENGIKIGADGWPKLPALGWLITGGESGAGARPSHPDWFRSLRDQCEEAGVPFLFKQHGNWREPLPGEEYDTSLGRIGKPPAFIVSRDGTVHCFQNDHIVNGRVMIEVGKKRAGRLLDGIEHNGFPMARPA